jgi:hypothetical protein
MDITKLGQESAFACANEKSHQKGINKRFYAACAAMQGLLSQHIIHVEENLTDKDYKQEPAYKMKFMNNDPDYAFLVRDAYEISDELLKQESL